MHPETFHNGITIERKITLSQINQHLFIENEKRIIVITHDDGNIEHSSR